MISGLLQLATALYEALADLLAGWSLLLAGCWLGGCHAWLLARSASRLSVMGEKGLAREREQA